MVVDLDAILERVDDDGMWADLPEQAKLCVRMCVRDAETLLEVAESQDSDYVAGELKVIEATFLQFAATDELVSGTYDVFGILLPFFRELLAGVVTALAAVAGQVATAALQGALAKWGDD